MNQIKVRCYALRVLNGKISIDDVPEEYREAVIAYLENL